MAFMRPIAAPHKPRPGHPMKIAFVVDLDRVGILFIDQMVFK